MARNLRLLLSAGILAAAASAQACDALNAYLPALAFCGDQAKPSELAKLAEGPALFVDAIRTVAGEVGGQTQAVGNGLQKGFDVSQQALQALGPYNYSGTGTYTRAAADDRSFRLRFFYGNGVAGKSPDTPVEADLARLDSYVTAPNFTNGFDLSNARGPLFPLIEATGISSGKLAFNDAALRFDVGSILKTTLKGYNLSLGLGTGRNTISTLVQQVNAGKLTLSLADTAMTNAAQGFSLSITKFDLTAGLDGSTSLGGDYGFAVTNGALKYFGAVKTVGGIPALSLSCTQTTTPFATVSFASGKADVKINADSFPITLPGLAPLKNP
ncbi:MAG: hypothetical protein JWM80_3609 [Cyanobacteria bacterium RYN_339]|nr:hypothetical protein [Cyanobacteria bacterium RYN_339]